MIIQCKDQADRLAKMQFAKQMIANGYGLVRRKSNGELCFFKSRIANPDPKAFPAAELIYHVAP